MGNTPSFNARITLTYLEMSTLAAPSIGCSLPRPQTALLLLGTRLSNQIARIGSRTKASDRRGGPMADQSGSDPSPDEMRERRKEYFEYWFKGTHYLLLAHAVGLITCLTLLKD